MNRLECMVLVGLQVGWEEVALCVPARCKDLLPALPSHMAHASLYPQPLAAPLAPKVPAQPATLLPCSSGALPPRPPLLFAPSSNKTSGFFLLSAPASSS